MDFFNMRFSLAVLLLVAVAQMTHALPASRSKRMAGGTLAPPVPWQAMVYLSDTIVDGGIAGGALISERWVLTAARNLFVRKNQHDTHLVLPKVYLGIRGREEATNSTEAEVEKVVVHPGFRAVGDWDHNLALLKLRKPVVIGDKVAPIPLPERGQNLTGSTAVLAGWGWGDLLSYSRDLKYLRLPLISQSTCREELKHIPKAPIVDDSMLCTGAAAFGDNVCTGDSGGALALRDPSTGDVYAVGILSYDKVCRQNQYGVYVKISSYLPWIHSVIRGDMKNSKSVRSTAMTQMLSRQ